ncbi:MAG: hypothetical protein U9N11_08575 [Campylobacterota bacterium]|nr:hypothetical protein [Campylobacterota bacterium]
MKNEVEIPTNEIDTLLSMVKKYRVFMITIVLISLVVSTLYAFLMHVPEYRAVAKIQIGKRGGVLVEPLEAIKTKIVQNYSSETNNEINSFHIDIEDEKEGTLRFTTTGENKNILHNYLNKVLSNIPKEHNLTQTYEEYLEYFQAKLDLATEDRAKTKRVFSTLRKSTLKNTDKIIEDLKQNTELDLTDEKVVNKELLATLQVAKNYYLVEQLKTYQDRHIALIKWAKKKMSPKYTYETQIIGEVYVKRITTSKSIIVTTSVVSAVLLSVLLVLFLSFLAERKEED